MYIVTDGKRFAVRKGWFFWTWRYLDIVDTDYWWTLEEYVEKFCWGTLEEARDAINRAKRGKIWRYEDKQL